MKKRINPISYLGWLGIVGVIGINTGDFMLQLFLIYFIFFTYRNMPADELFWLNIRKSATRAFILEIILNYICLFNYLFISSQMSAKPYFIGSTGILLLW